MGDVLQRGHALEDMPYEFSVQLRQVELSDQTVSGGTGWWGARGVLPVQRETAGRTRAQLRGVVRATCVSERVNMAKPLQV